MHQAAHIYCVCVCVCVCISHKKKKLFVGAEGPRGGGWQRPMQERLWNLFLLKFNVHGDVGLSD